MLALLLKLQRLAGFLRPLRYLIIAFTAAALLLVVYCLLIDSAFTANMLEPAIVAALWGLIIISFTQLFQTLPDPPLPHEGFFRRLLARLKNLLYCLLALLMLLVMLLLTGMSFRLLLL